MFCICILNGRGQNQTRVVVNTEMTENVLFQPDQLIRSLLIY